MTKTAESPTPTFNPSNVQTTADNLPEKWVKQYQADGFIKIPGIISKDEASFYHEEALRIAKDDSFKRKLTAYQAVLNQTVNVWQISPTMKALTLHPNVAAIAKKLSGVSLRLWHDHLLVKNPHNGAKTEWHQDQPYWPHNGPNPISAWIALCDVPPERGSMSFIAGEQSRNDIPVHSLTQEHSLFDLSPDMEWKPKVTLPLQAGDCTFHHGRTPHMANANETDDYRIAHVIIYMDENTVFTGNQHAVTKDLGLEEGEILEGELFPKI